MSDAFLDTVKNRRSIYALKKESTIPDSKLEQIVEHAITHVPSALNSQSTRVLMVVREEHDKLWDTIRSVLKEMVPESQWAATEKKLDGFKAGYGTILFFEHRTTVSEFEQKYPIFAPYFLGWASQASALHQYTIWTALAAEGMGCNLQHYNPLIDERVRNEWGLPVDWENNAQLVFGKPAGPPGEKTFLSVKDRIRTAGLKT